MGYYVRLLKQKKTDPKWKIQFVSYKKEHQKVKSNAKEKKRTWDIPKERWGKIGFHLCMSFQDAQARVKQLNCQIKIKRQEEHIFKYHEIDKKMRLKYDSMFPDEFVAEFEERFIRPWGILSKKQRKNRTTRRLVLWRAVQKLITTIHLEPTDWFYNTYEIYDYFYQQKLSLGYIQSILKLSNLWGYFISRKLSKPFNPIPHPKGYERQRLIEVYYQKKSARRPSSPITPNDLNIIKNKINQENFNWLFLSVWLGLRPMEIDLLKDDHMWIIDNLPSNKKVLWVFQTKIIALPPEDRWKPIPIIFDEQFFALEIIKSKYFKRPLVKTIKYHISSNANLYGGRKGFVDLMLSRGQRLENISIWMGHSTLSRTWRSYKNKRVYHF